MPGAVARRAECLGIMVYAQRKHPNVNSGQRPSGRGIDRHTFERRILSEGAQAKEERKRCAVPHAPNIAPAWPPRIRVSAKDTRTSENVDRIAVPL